MLVSFPMDDKTQEVIGLLACHIGARVARRSFCFQGIFPGKGEPLAVSFEDAFCVARFQGQFRGKCPPFKVPL